MRIKRGKIDRGSSRVIYKGYSKKGQVTIFIIIGIVMLMVMAVILYVTSSTQIKPILDESQRATNTAPTQLHPVQSFIEGCMRQVAVTGLRALGQQGGYIHPEVMGEFHDDPTEAVGVYLNPSKVPYWHYNVQPNPSSKVVYSSLRPELYSKDDDEMSIEAQLSRHVQSKLDTCLGDFQTFTNQGYKVNVDSSKKITTRIGAEAVDFTLDMDIEASRGDSETRLNKFYVRVPLNLKHYYDLASRIAEAERNYYFLESQFLSLLGAFASTPDSPLPPTYTLSFEYASSNVWNVRDTTTQLKSLITSYVPLLQVQSAHNIQYPDDLLDFSGLQKQNFDNKILPIPGAEDVEVRFDYFGWEPYINLNDNDGLIRPQETFVQQLFFTMGMQRYYTTYDVSYPIIVTIDDPLALDGLGYRFMFALESNIKNNDRVTEADDVLTPPTLLPTSLACQGNQKNSEIIRSVVVDSWTQEPLDLVRVGFTIPNQDDCFIGLTNEQGELSDKYPEVYGGLVNFIKEDYLTNFYPIDTYEVTQDSNIIGYSVANLEQPVIQMHKFKPVNISVKKKPIGKCVTPQECTYTEGAAGIVPFSDISCSPGVRQCFFPSSGELLGPKHIKRFEVNESLSVWHDYFFLESQNIPLEAQETAILSLTRLSGIDPTELGGEHSVTAFVKGTQKVEQNLVPGIYEVTGNLMYEKEVTIPADKRNIRYTIITVDSEVEFEMSAMNMSSYANGELLWEDDKTYLVITPEQLYANDELTFIFPSQELQHLPKTITTKREDCDFIIAGSACSENEVRAPGIVIEDLSMLSLMKNVSSWYRGSYEPIWGAVS